MGAFRALLARSTFKETRLVLHCLYINYKWLLLILRHVGPKWLGDSSAWMEKAHFSISELDSSCCSLQAHSYPGKRAVLCWMNPSSVQFRIHSLWSPAIGTFPCWIFLQKLIPKTSYQLKGFIYPIGLVINHRISALALWDPSHPLATVYIIIHYISLLTVYLFERVSL